MTGRLCRNFTGRQVMAEISINTQTTKTMKTMMDLLISLRRVDAATETANRNRQLSPGEKQAARRHVDLVREVIPPEVLAHYDELNATDHDLLESPELLAMSVLLTTYRSLSPRKRKKLLKHFAVTPQNHSPGRSPKSAARVRAGRCQPQAFTNRLVTAA